MNNETNPGTVDGRKFYIVWNEARNEGFTTDDEQDAIACYRRVRRALSSTVGDAFAETYEYDELSLEVIDLAAQSQPAATAQEAIDFKYWLMDAARILRSNGTDTHASWVEKALAALSPSKAVEPAPEQGEELQAALRLDDNGFSDAECIAISLDRYARDAKRSGLPLTAQVNEKAAWLIRSMAAALAHPSPAPQQPQSVGKMREALEEVQRTLEQPQPAIACTIWCATKPAETLLDHVTAALTPAHQSETLPSANSGESAEDALREIVSRCPAGTVAVKIAASFLQEQEKQNG